MKKEVFTRYKLMKTSFFNTYLEKRMLKIVAHGVNR